MVMRIYGSAYFSNCKSCARTNLFMGDRHRFRLNFCEDGSLDADFVEREFVPSNNRGFFFFFIYFRERKFI